MERSLSNGFFWLATGCFILGVGLNKPSFLASALVALLVAAAWAVAAGRR